MSEETAAQGVHVVVQDYLAGMRQSWNSDLGLRDPKYRAWRPEKEAGEQPPVLLDLSLPGPWAGSLPSLSFAYSVGKVKGAGLDGCSPCPGRGEGRLHATLPPLFPP